MIGSPSLPMSASRKQTLKDSKENNSRENPMRRRVPTGVLFAAAGLVLLWHTGESGAQPVLETGPDAEVTADGLHPVHPSIMPAAWVRPDVDLSRYTRIFFMPIVVQFREIPERRYRIRRFDSRTEFPISDAMRPRLRELFGESFYEAVSGVRSYELSDELGRDVLMAQGFLTDITSGVPPDVTGSNIGTVRWALNANIVLELRDSMSGEVVARTVDHQRIEGPFDAAQVWALAPRIAHGWSTLLIRRLRELSDLYPSKLRRLQELSGE